MRKDETRTIAMRKKTKRLRKVTIRKEKKRKKRKKTNGDGTVATELHKKNRTKEMSMTEIRNQLQQP